jgi:SET domain-containing protein
VRTYEADKMGMTVAEGKGRVGLRIAPACRLPDAMIEIRRTARKGRGVFATEEIAAGAVIAACPVLVCAPSESGLIGRTRLGEYQFRWADKRQTCIAFGVVSLCNHDESPNAELVPDAREETITLVAARTITVGEEVTIRYRKRLSFVPA